MLKAKSTNILILFLAILLGIVIIKSIPNIYNSYSRQAIELCGKYFSFCSFKFSTKNISLGIFDPHQDFQKSNLFGIDHHFLLWDLFDKDTFKNWSMSAKSNNRWLLITVEPSHDADPLLLKNITLGVYDEKIKDVCDSFNQSSNPVFIRFAHEMENINGRYPWATPNHGQFIASYQHFVSKCKSVYKNGFYVWSPAGNKNMGDYFPGREYVDYVGISFYYLPAFEKDRQKKSLSIQSALSQKYKLAKIYERPIMIAEFGFPNFLPNRNLEFANFLHNLKNFPQIKSLIFFNDVDRVGAWPEKYGIPDWRLEMDDLNSVNFSQ